MEEKPFEQLIIESLLKDVYTLSFAKVTKVDNATSFLEVKSRLKIKTSIFSLIIQLKKEILYLITQVDYSRSLKSAWMQTKNTIIQ